MGNGSMQCGWRWKEEGCVSAIPCTAKLPLQPSFIFEQKFLESVWQIVYMRTRIKNVLVSEGVTP